MTDKENRDWQEPSAESLAKEREVARRRRNNLVIVAAVLAVLMVAGVASWLLLQSRKSGAGRPVPAPRTISMEQAGAGEPTSLTEQTITIAPEMVERAGIKTEQVGEQLVTDGGVTGGQSASGVVRENAYRTTPVVSLVGGIVRTVNVELGQNVSRGQTVAVVFSNELAMAQSRYLNAIAELDEHHKHHRRTMRLVEIGAASREEMEQATTKLRTAESEVAFERQKLLLLGLTTQRINQLRSSSQVSSEVSVPAPLAGSVITRTANPGEVVESNKEILRIADLSSVWVVGQVYEKDLGRIGIGSGTSVTTDAYPGRVFRGKVSYVDPTLDPATRTAQVRIELANPGQALKIGMFVNVAFGALGSAELTNPTVLKDAVQSINNQQVVFVATKEPNVFALRRIRIGPEVNGRYPVLEGLNAGDRIVTEGSFLLRAEWLKQHPDG
ncbi:MAG: efflux RND transporter periplasmic adaptor subunit [Acidobacteriota bacterium]|nr:efflux RND transporter periplasmic adaptor subunit [Acidobacteriota bacterium]